MNAHQRRIAGRKTSREWPDGTKVRCKIVGHEGVVHMATDKKRHSWRNAVIVKTVRDHRIWRHVNNLERVK